MTFVPTPNCARVVVGFSQGSWEFSNIFHFTKSSFVDADMEALAAAIDEWVDQYWLSCIGDGITYLSTDVYDIRTSTGSIITDNTHTGPGTRSGEELPASLSVVVTLRSAARGRTGRGRKYVAGWIESDLESGLWIQQAQTNAVAYCTGIAGAGAGEGWAHVLRSTQVDGVAQNPALTRLVTDYESRSSVPGTQRRRMDRP